MTKVEQKNLFIANKYSLLLWFSIKTINLIFYCKYIIMNLSNGKEPEIKKGTTKDKDGCKMKQSTMVHSFLFDIMQAVSEPMTTIEHFKESVLRIISQNMNIDCLKFVDYRIGDDGETFNVLPNTTALNLPGDYWDDLWVKNYYKTCIYNPENPAVCQRLHDLHGNCCIMKISDLMTFSEYEGSRNFQEVVEPSGLYYSMIIYFRDNDRLIASLDMIRPKEDGDFTEEEMNALKSICPYVCNRLLDYYRVRAFSGYETLVSDVLSMSSDGLMLLDDRMCLITGNNAAKEICGKIYPASKNPMKRLAETIANRSRFRETRFMLNDTDGALFDVFVNPYHINSESCRAVANLVSIKHRAFAKSESHEVSSFTPEDLTDRQKEIVGFIAEGMTNREIANRMMISENTVRKHIENIRLRLGVSSRIGILRELSIVTT